MTAPTAAELGTKGNPRCRLSDGIPYGDHCICAKCGFVGQSTISHDYYHIEDGVHAGKLLCESCLRGCDMRAVEAIMQQAVAEDRAHDADTSKESSHG